MTTVAVVVKKKTQPDIANKSVSSYRAKQDAKQFGSNCSKAPTKPFNKTKSKQVAKPQGPCNLIYSSMELTSGSQSEARILQFNLVIPDTTPGSVDFKRETILCNNDGVEISPEAQEYHGITVEMVADAPLAKDIKLPTYGFIAMWDGFVGNILLNTNNISIRKGSLIDLHKLLRFTKEHASHRISLKKAAIEATDGSLSPEQIEAFLASSQNKVMLLPIIMDYIRNIYRTKYGITDLGALARLSRQANKKAYLETLKRIRENGLRKKSLHGKRNSKSGVKKPNHNYGRNNEVKNFPRPARPKVDQSIKAVA